LIFLTDYSRAYETDFNHVLVQPFHGVRQFLRQTERTETVIAGFT